MKLSGKMAAPSVLLVSFLSLTGILTSCKGVGDDQQDGSVSAGYAKPASEFDGQASNVDYSLKGGGNSAVVTTKGRGWVSYFSGNSTDSTVTPQGGLLLVGGGTDRDDAMQWFVDRAGRGDIVVLRASGSDGYNDWLMAKGADSVDSIVFSSSAASSDPAVMGRISTADGIFFAGGDQSFYVKYWKDTPLEKLVNDMAARGVPVGGTSAGLAILGQFLYPALNNSATSSEALADPFNRNVMLDRDFLALPRLNGLITDSHFAPRDRMGRLLVFMARILQAGWVSSVRAIGIDETAALAVDQNGKAHVLADSGNIYMLRSTVSPAVCKASTPLTLAGVETIRLSAGQTFDLGIWSGNGVAYKLSVNAGVVSSSSGSIY